MKLKLPYDLSRRQTASCNTALLRLISTLDGGWVVNATPRPL